MTYWVYENWRAHGHRATVHRGECGHCNDGSGQGGGTRADNGQWLGPYKAADEAAAAARATGAGAASHEDHLARAMSLPETDVARARRWVAEQNERIAEHIDEMRVEMDVDARALTICAGRPPWREDFGPDWTRQEIARMRYTKSTGVWTLYRPDRIGKFHCYEDLKPTPTLDRLLAEIDADPICIFWG